MKTWVVGQSIVENSYGLFNKSQELMLTNPNGFDLRIYRGTVKPITRTMIITGERWNRFGDCVPVVKYTDWQIARIA